MDIDDLINEGATDRDIEMFKRGWDACLNRKPTYSMDCPGWDLNLYL